MSTVVIVGTQWGDEGKGKVIDYLAKQADLVVRGQGGNNAGHSVVIGDETYALHLIPSGILYKDKLNIIGNGVVFDPKGFLDEIDGLAKRGVDVSSIKVSGRSHVIFPYHKYIDALAEDARGAAKIGTTKKGIGPCYMDKVERSGLRLIDFVDQAKFEKKFRAQAEKKNKIITSIYDGEPMDIDAIIEEYNAYAKRIKPFVSNTIVTVNEAYDAGKNILLEGAQGTLLDIDYGTYPYVTSSHPTSGGFAVGSGLAPNRIEEVVGITKAYTTRVGKGPFVTELLDDVGEKIRQEGHEFGTTTGRSRRCGWFDVVVVNHAKYVNGLTSIALMKGDIFSGFDEIKICTAYKLDGEIIHDFPMDLEDLERCEPVYETVPGWKEDICECKSYDQLPENARKYVERIEELIGVPIKIVSVGPKRSQTIIRESIF